MGGYRRVVKRFDAKFGADFLARLEAGPAVYLFKDADGRVLYVGKAKDVRRRLSQYRNASRRKAHRKMRAIVRESSQLEVRRQSSETDALATENELIRTLQPAFNVAGKYSFLYPAIGLRRTDSHSLFCFTTDTAAWKEHQFEWYGTFSGRIRAKEAFDALIELLSLVAHLERSSTLRAGLDFDVPDVRGSRLVGLRQLDGELFDVLRALFAGSSRAALSSLFAALLEKPRARREAAWVQEQLRTIREFYDDELVDLHDALRRAQRAETFVPQHERDVLFIRFGSTTKSA